MWNQLIEVDVPANPAGGLWTKVHDYIAGPTKLKITATGDWTPRGQQKYGPDGDRRAGFVDNLLVPSAPRGALIGKVGGSTAEKPDAAKPDAAIFVFVAGSACVVELSATAKGALFFTMNDKPSDFDDHSGQIKVTVHQAA